MDSKAVMILVGTEMDYVEDDIKAEFVFRNPNEKVMQNKDNLGIMRLWREFPHLILCIMMIFN